MKEVTESKQLVFKDKKEALEAFKEFLRDKVSSFEFVVYFIVILFCIINISFITVHVATMHERYRRIC